MSGYNIGIGVGLRYIQRGVVDLMAQTIRSSMVVWYDLKRQGATNESMSQNPILKDLSGHGHDATCYNFAWTENSGISSTSYLNALVSDGVDDYCIVEGLPILTDYTVIAKRKWIKTEYDTFATFSSKSNSTADGEFIFERIDSEGHSQVYSFGVPARITLAENITYQTPTSYNGKIISKGDFLGNDRLSLFALRGIAQYSNIALYSFILFDRTLTDKEIEWVKKNLLDVETPEQKYSCFGTGQWVMKYPWINDDLWKMKK